MYPLLPLEARTALAYGGTQYLGVFSAKFSFPLGHTQQKTDLVHVRDPVERWNHYQILHKNQTVDPAAPNSDTLT